MRNLQRTLWAAAFSAFLAGGASAQTTGTATTGTTGTTTGTTGTTGGGNGNTPGAAAATAAQQALQAPVIAAPSASTAASSVLSASNVFGRYYNNPYYQGRASTASSTSTNTPGGFGAALYPTTGAGASNTGSGTTAAGGRTGGTTAGTAGAFGGSTTGFGGNTGVAAGRAGQQGGFGNTANANSNQQNNGLSTGRQIAYTATLKFAAPSLPAPQMQIDLRSMLDTSIGLADAKNVSVTAAEGGLIVLKGTAKDEDEAKLVEGMIRLTPGVRSVQNELKFPPQ